MKKFPIVLDLETKLTFRQQPDPKSGISVVAITTIGIIGEKLF
jgi:hypothetical protein